MADFSICEVCRTCDSEVACLCKFPLPQICNGCYHIHTTKGSSHVITKLSDVHKVRSDDDLHCIRRKLLDIEQGEKVLALSLKKIDCCEQEINDFFSELISDIKKIQMGHVYALRVIKIEVESLIREAVNCAKSHAIDISWEDSFGNNLAKKLWNNEARAPKKEFLLFEYQVTREDEPLDKLICVQMMAKRMQPKFPDSRYLWIISEESLFLFDVMRCSWGHFSLYGDVLRSWECSWDSALAPFDDNFRLLCTGGGSPLTNSVYEVNRMNGSVRELSPMGSARAGHGLTQFKGKFYAFGGHGAPDTAEMFTPNEDQGAWEPLGSMQASHSWFNSCVYNDTIYIGGGHSSTVEVFNPATKRFTVFPGLRLSGDLAESNLSVAIHDDEFVFLTSLLILRCDLQNRVSLGWGLQRKLRSVWACMTPLVGKDERIYLPCQERGSVWAVDINKLDFIEFKKPGYSWMNKL